VLAGLPTVRFASIAGILLLCGEPPLGADTVKKDFASTCEQY
jgi:hypothetical protein